MNEESRDGKQPLKGGQQQQAQAGEGQQYGEGNYKAARDYNKALKDHVEHHDIEKEARDAAPRDAAEATEMEDAERYAAGKARGTDTPEDPDDGK